MIFDIFFIDCLLSQIRQAVGAPWITKHSQVEHTVLQIPECKQIVSYIKLQKIFWPTYNISIDKQSYKGGGESSGTLPSTPGNVRYTAGRIKIKEVLILRIRLREGTCR